MIMLYFGWYNFNWRRKSLTTVHLEAAERMPSQVIPEFRNCSPVSCGGAPGAVSEQSQFYIWKGWLREEKKRDEMDNKTSSALFAFTFKSLAIKWEITTLLGIKRSRLGLFVLIESDVNGHLRSHFQFSFEGKKRFRLLYYLRFAYYLTWVGHLHAVRRLVARWQLVPHAAVNPHQTDQQFTPIYVSWVNAVEVSGPLHSSSTNLFQLNIKFNVKFTLEAHWNLLQLLKTILKLWQQF